MKSPRLFHPLLPKTDGHHDVLFADDAYAHADNIHLVLEFRTNVLLTLPVSCSSLTSRCDACVATSYDSRPSNIMLSYNVTGKLGHLGTNAKDI